MTPRFLSMIPFLWEWEGTKYENDPSDPGGETRWGVDKRSHPDVDIRHLTEDHAKQIYWDLYWTRYQCEERSYPMGEVVFNCCVNAGYGRVQKIVAVIGVSVTAKSFLDEQDAFYKRLAHSRPSSEKFLKGWLNRTRALRTHLGLLSV